MMDLPMHRWLPALAAALLFTVSVQAAPVEGRDYARLPTPQAPESAGKLEVIEFFSYGCPHCYHMHPLITPWSAKLPSNVTFLRVPVSMGHRQWGQLVRAYYALQATGDLKRLDDALFAAIHERKQQLYDEESLAAWAASQGVDGAKFRAAFNSMDVSTKAARAEQLSRDYQVQGIPQVVVGGKFIAMGNDYGRILDNTTQLIELAAKEKK